MTKIKWHEITKDGLPPIGDEILYFVKSSGNIYFGEKIYLEDTFEEFFISSESSVSHDLHEVTHWAEMIDPPEA